MTPSGHGSPRYSFVVPTFRRPDMLEGCLESLVALDYPSDRIEVIVVDNGGASEHSGDVGRRFRARLALRYFVNRVNQGYGYSVNRGLAEAQGDLLVILNDDARPAADMLRLCDDLLSSSHGIGCVGCRPIEAGYQRSGEGIGRISERGEVVANFDIDCGDPIDVEHVYGFCYVFTRQALELAGLNDRTLLAKPYSSGNRIETSHCLSIREKGLRVVFHPKMVAVHLAKPRPDMSERSPRWKLNATRNTIYLYLKHFGPLGKGAAALRLTFLDDVGLLSLLRHPTRENAAYFSNGLHARVSAYWHWIRYRVAPTNDSVTDLQHELARSEGGVLW